MTAHRLETNRLRAYYECQDRQSDISKVKELILESYSALQPKSSLDGLKRLLDQMNNQSDYVQLYKTLRCIYNTQGRYYTVNKTKDYLRQKSLLS